MSQLTVLEFPEIDSTSTCAQALLDAGTMRPPFAVRADAQTSGRGRRGASWESGKNGNLYLTVVLPPDAQQKSLALAPLKAAVIVARFLARTTGVHVTLKWPNDLLFAGRKLGGLLLESSLRGSEAGAVLVGIGMNLASAPVLPAPARAVSLAQILGPGKVPDVRALGDGLAAALTADWAALSEADVLSAFEERAIAAGHLWRSGPIYRASKGVRPDGALLLGDSALSSVDHDYQWIYQGTNADEHPLIVADVGNTSTKLGQGADDAEAFADADEAALGRWLDAAATGLPARPWPLWTLSVSPRRAERLARIAAPRGFDVALLPKRPVRRRPGGYPLAELGIDRLAMIEAWLAPAPVRAGLVVAAGTATTLDVVDADGTHRGGLILAGLQTSLDALHAATGLLPPLSARAEHPTTMLGQGTRSAMANGALVAAVSAVAAVAAAAGVERGGIVLTGGLAPLLAPHLEGASIVPNLALAGARVLALGGVLPAEPDA